MRPLCASTQVSGSQLTVCWSVDNLKISHKAELAVTGLAAKLGKMHGGKLTVSRGKAHDHLGMGLKFSIEPGAVIASMTKHLQKVTEELPKVLHGTKPAQLEVTCLTLGQVVSGSCFRRKWQANFTALWPSCCFCA